jgi:hypothetical protein
MSVLFSLMIVDILSENVALNKNLFLLDWLFNIVLNIF